MDTTSVFIGYREYVAWCAWVGSEGCTYREWLTMAQTRKCIAPFLAGYWKK